MNEEVGHGTIYPAPSFDADAEADAAVLKKAMKGMGESKLHISFGWVHWVRWGLYWYSRTTRTHVKEL